MNDIFTVRNMYTKYVTYKYSQQVRDKFFMIEFMTLMYMYTASINSETIKKLQVMQYLQAIEFFYCIKTICNEKIF